MQGINQLQRSALRRALQHIFIEGTLIVYSNLSNNNSDEEKFNISCKSMLFLVGLRSSTDIDNQTMEEITRLMKEKEIISSTRKKSHQHHRLVKGCITKLNKKSMKLGVESISSLMLNKELKKERIEHFENPWNHVLPEDIGSCYEVIMECKIVESEGNYNLVQRKDRRNSGIHHTPFDLTEHMCDLAITKSTYDKSEITEFLAVDIAHGAGAFTLQMARKISRLKNLEIQTVLSDFILGD